MENAHTLHSCVYLLVGASGGADAEEADGTIRHVDGDKGNVQEHSGTGPTTVLRATNYICYCCLPPMSR